MPQQVEKITSTYKMIRKQSTVVVTSQKLDLPIQVQTYWSSVLPMSAYTFNQPGFQTEVGNNTTYSTQPITTDKFDSQKQGSKLK